MSDIYDRNWLNVVFEGRNQQYGAYQLRRQSGRTTLLAFTAALMLLGAVVGVPLLASNVWDSKTGPVADSGPLLKDSIKVVVFDHKKLIFEEKRKAGKKLVAETKPGKKFVNMVPSSAPDIENPPIISDFQNHSISNSDTPGTAAGGDNGGGTSTGGDGPGEHPGEVDVPSNEPMMTGSLEQSPEFPGGIEKFYAFVGRNFRAPEENIGRTKVIVSFVVERDGSMTDVKVMRNPGYGMDKEAIRVLKSLKTQWSPGIYKGQKVRTLYSLPIIVDPT